MTLFNSPEFAKEILWRLARNHADNLDNKMLLIEILSHQTGRTAKEILAERKKACDTKANDLYLESLKLVGFASHTDTIQGDDPHR